MTGELGLDGARRAERVAMRALAQQQRLHHRLRQLGELELLLFAELARRAVDHAQRAQALAAGQHQRRAGVEADAGLAGDQRVVGEARIGARVGHGHHIALEDGVGAERKVARRLLHAGQAEVGLEPLALVVNQADQRDRRAGDLRGQAGEAVEQRLRRRVQHGQRAQARQALNFVGGQRRGSHVCSKPRCSMNLTTVSRPVPRCRFVITYGLRSACAGRMRRVSASITARSAPT